MAKCCSGKKGLLLLGGVVALLAALTFGIGNLWTAGEVAVDEVRTSLKDAVPVPVKIKMLEQKVQELTPEIANAKEIVARQEVQLEKLNEGIETQQAAVDKQWGEILALREALQSGDGTEYVTVGGAKHTRDAVTEELERRYDRFQVADDALTQKKELRKAREKMLEANRRSLDNLITAKEQAALLVGELQARMETVKAKKSERLETIDDSVASEFKDLYDEADEQLRVQERLIEMDGDDVGDIKVNPRPKRDILEEIDARRADKAADGQGTELINDINVQ